MADNDGLTEAERAELEQLRAEKAAREEAKRQSAERAELERLRAERAVSVAEAAEDARIAESRERGRKLMEPDEDDLKMPAGQKMVLAVIAVIIVVMLAMQFLGGR